MDKKVVRELIQDELIADNLFRALNDLLNDPVQRKLLEEDYDNLRMMLGKKGNASANAAKSIVAFLRP